MKLILKGSLPVEISVDNQDVEQERKKLNQLALTEYEETGTLSSQKLCEACADFEQKASVHVDARQEYMECVFEDPYMES